jgi:hypothetical protein
MAASQRATVAGSWSGCRPRDNPFLQTGRVSLCETCAPSDPYGWTLGERGTDSARWSRPASCSGGARLLPLAAGGALVIAGLAAWAGIQLQREAMQGELVSLRVDALPAVADPAGTYFMLSFDVHNDGPGSDFDVKAPPHSVVGTTGDGGDDYGTFPLCWQHSEAGESRCWLSKDGAERVDLAVVANDRATVRFIQPGARAAAARLWMTRTPTDSTVTGTIELIDVNRDTRRLFRFVIDLEPSDAPTLTVEPLTVEPTRPAEDGR